jgi:hypothetical protein
MEQFPANYAIALANALQANLHDHPSRSFSGRMNVGVKAARQS